MSLSDKAIIVTGKCNGVGYECVKVYAGKRRRRIGVQALIE